MPASNTVGPVEPGAIRALAGTWESVLGRRAGSLFRAPVVVVLLFPCCPPAVGGSVTFFVVDAIQC